MKRSHYQELGKIAAVLLGLSAVTAEFYPLRELMAALAIFAILFAVVGTAVLLFVLVDEAASQGINRLETRLAYARAAHRPAAVPRRSIRS